MRYYPLYIILLMALMLNACRLGKQYMRPDVGLPSKLNSAEAKTDSMGLLLDTTWAMQQQDTFSIAQLEWWRIYTNKTLQKLLYEALEHNKDLKIAAARIKELAALRGVDLANLLPQLNGSMYGQKEGLNYGGDRYKNDPEFGAKLMLSWEVDLWGNLRWARDKGIAQFVGSIENQNALRSSLIAQVAQSYFELVAMDNELSIIRQTLHARTEGARLAKLRFEGGLTSETSYQQAQLEYARTATLLPELERKISIKQNEIAFLAGSYPSYIERETLKDNLQIPEQLPFGLPSALMEQRPDIRMAEQNLIAANATVGVSYTNMFPKLKLTAQFGLESEELQDLIKSPMHFLGANLLAPIFAMGKNRAIYKAKKAAFEQSCYTYEKVVLNAFKEVYNAIVDFNKIREILQVRRQFEQSAKATMEFAQLQYLNGVIGYMEVLDAQRNHFDAQVNLSNAIRDQQISLVRLYKALGGGWNLSDKPQ
ncbi:MAG: efflux transporter outer membrane subunit [Bacteroidales bacterium]